MYVPTSYVPSDGYDRPTLPPFRRTMVEVRRWKKKMKKNYQSLIVKKTCIIIALVTKRYYDHTFVMLDSCLRYLQPLSSQVYKTRKNTRKVGRRNNSTLGERVFYRCLTRVLKSWLVDRRWPYDPFIILLPNRYSKFTRPVALTIFNWIGLHLSKLVLWSNRGHNDYRSFKKFFVREYIWLSKIRPYFINVIR